MKIRVRVSALVTALIVNAGLAVQVRAAEAPLIQIAVEVVEVDQEKTQKLGVDWINPLHVEEAAVPSLLKIGTVSRDKVFADLHVLLEEGAADLLANPKLVARDSSTATFEAGGEIPYASAGGLGTSQVEFKPYGVRLKISPRLEAAGKIALAIETEVSSPDTQNSVTLAGNVVPGIRSRRVQTELTLDPGATLTMAGLIQQNKEWKRRGIPGLMHIPLLGYLFSHKVELSRRTSVVVFITPVVLRQEPIHAMLP